MTRLAPLHEQPHAHDLEVELIRLLVGGRNRGLSHECICQALLAAFYRLNVAEVGADPHQAVALIQHILECGMDEYILACQKEAAALSTALRPDGVTLQ